MSTPWFVGLAPLIRGPSKLMRLVKLHTVSTTVTTTCDDPSDLDDSIVVKLLSEIQALICAVVRPREAETLVSHRPILDKMSVCVCVTLLCKWEAARDPWPRVAESMEKT
eukprot:1141746-Rhodomonas_salina.1